MNWRVIDESLYLPGLNKLRFNTADEAIDYLEQEVLNGTWPNAWFIKKRMRRYFIGVFNGATTDSFETVAIIQPV